MAGKGKKRPPQREIRVSASAQSSGQAKSTAKISHQFAEGTDKEDPIIES